MRLIQAYNRMKETTSIPRATDSLRLALSVAIAGIFAILFTGCMTYRVYPHLRDVPPGNRQVIDGQYGDLRIEEGRAYTTKKFNKYMGRNRVVIYDLKKIGPGQYIGQGESHNDKKRLSSFGPVTIDIIEPYKILLTYRANTLTGLKEGWSAKWTARKLDDAQGFLRELLRKPNITLSARIHAAARITDRELLESLTGADADPAVRLAAEVSLGRRTWENVIRQAESDPTMIGPALAAIAWADNQNALSKRATSLCHSYIRLGDERYIPDLVELLRRYGDKRLAEDYMNCGQSKLDAAGADWARKHGYRVTSGQGSHRARWGEGR